MLVLQRRVGESILLGSEIEVRILGLRNGQVKIGVIAPKHVEIRRNELEEINRRAVVGDWRTSSLAALAQRLKNAGRAEADSKPDPEKRPAEP
ncbi:MAG: carbon storage regulator [Acidobacteria bacterium]|nr:carbon storage regulator [Acidobacteriota bacterium]